MIDDDEHEHEYDVLGLCKICGDSKISVVIRNMERLDGLVDVLLDEVRHLEQKVTKLLEAFSK
jgi:hypothetical protein